jgi:hypothetical protein
MIIEVKNLGVPVMHPSKDTPSGAVVRWSSDPEVAPDAPAHVVVGNAEFQRFMKLTVPEEFINKAAMVIHPILIEKGRNSVSKQEAIDAGASPDSWDNVRTLTVIIGKNKTQPEAITKEWYGLREDYFAKQHILDAARYAKDNNIDAPVIFTDSEIHQVLNAATGAHKHLLMMNPALRTAKLMDELLERSLSNLDVDAVHPDRAVHILGEIKNAAIAHQDMKNQHNAAFGLSTDTILGVTDNLAGAPNTKAQSEDSELENAMNMRNSPGMRLH